MRFVRVESFRLKIKTTLIPSFILLLSTNISISFRCFYVFFCATVLKVANKNQVWEKSIMIKIAKLHECHFW